MKKILFLIFFLPSVAFAAPTEVGGLDSSGVRKSFLVGPSGALVASADPGSATWSACTANITDTTVTEIKALNAAAKHYVTNISISNLDDTTPTAVEIRDGPTTVLWLCPAAINGGGCTISFPIPIKGTVNTALNCKPITTGATVRCCASGYDSVD